MIINYITYLYNNCLTASWECRLYLVHMCIPGAWNNSQHIVVSQEIVLKIMNKRPLLVNSFNPKIKGILP